MPNVNLTDVVNVDAVMGVEGAAWALFAALLGVGLLTVRMYSVQRYNSFILTLLKNVFFFPLLPHWPQVAVSAETRVSVSPDTPA